MNRIPHCAGPAMACALSLLLSCSAPPDHPLSAAELEGTLLQRAASVELCRAALELLKQEPLSIVLPETPQSMHARDLAFWKAHALAFHPQVRRARWQLQSMRALEGVEGRPGPLMLDVNNRDFGGSERDTELSVTFDLLSLLKLGRAGAARNLAKAQVAETFAGLEKAVWQAQFDVQRALVRVASARAKLEETEHLHGQAEHDWRRIEILTEKGWIAPAESAWASAILQMVMEEQTNAHMEWSRELAELAFVSGLPLESDAVQSVTWTDVEELELEADGPERLPISEFLQRVPALREAQLRYAVAEARLRSEISLRWPSLRVGPQLVFVPDDLLPGGVLSLEVPFPGSTSRRIEAAVAEREAVRAELEDQVRESLGIVADLRVRVQGLAEHVFVHMKEKDAAASEMWRSAQARFLADPQALEAWSFALEHRIEPMLARMNARRDWMIARLDLREALGSDS